MRRGPRRRARRRRGEAPGVGAGPDLEVEVGQLGRLGAPRIDDDQRPRRVAGDLLQRRAGVGEAVGLPRVLADEDGDLGVLEVAAGVSAEHLGVDPELAGLLLGQRARPEARAERGARRRRSTRRRGGSPARRRRNRRSTPRRGCRAPRRSVRRPRGSRCPSRSPRTCRRGGGASGWSAGGGRSGSGRAAAPSRTCSPASRVGLVAADALEAAAVVTAEADLDAAVALAEDAGRRLPIASRRSPATQAASGRSLAGARSLARPSGFRHNAHRRTS